MKRSDRYLKIVEWSDEDHCYVGTCPSLMLGGVHGEDEAVVYRELCEVVEEWLEIYEERIGISFWTPPGLPSSSELQTPPQAIIRASRARRTGHGRPLRPLSTGTSPHDPSSSGFRTQLTPEPRSPGRASRHRFEFLVPRRPTTPSLLVAPFEVPENLVDHVVLGDERDDLHLGAA